MKKHDPLWRGPEPMVVLLRATHIRLLRASDGCGRRVGGEEALRSLFVSLSAIRIRRTAGPVADRSGRISLTACTRPSLMSLFSSNRESDVVGWSSSNPSFDEEYEEWLLGPPLSSLASSSGPDEEMRTIRTMDQVPEWFLLGSPEPLIQDQGENWTPLEPMRAQATPRRLISDAGWDAVRQRRTEQRHAPSSSNPQAGTSSGPWRPWDDRPATIQNLPSTSGPSNSNSSNATPSLYIPPDHKIVPPHPSEPPTKSRILELLNSMNEPPPALPSKGNDQEGAQEDEEDPTALSTFTCPVCFSPPENATLTPCGHVMCTFSPFPTQTLCILTEMGSQAGNVCLVPSKLRGSDMRDYMAARVSLLTGRGMKLYAQCVEPPYQGGTEEGVG